MPRAVNFWKKMNRSQGKSLLLCSHLLKCPRSISHCVSHLFKSTLVLPNVCQIYYVCANNHLQLKSSQLRHGNAGSHRIYRTCTLHIFTLVKRDSTFLFSLTELQNSEFKEYKISKPSSIVCIFAYAHMFLR